MKKQIRQSRDRLDVLARISEYERLGGEYYFKDVEADPPARTLMPEDVDYLNRKAADKIKAAVAVFISGIAEIFVKRKFRIRVVGAENIRGIKGGAVITSNHFSIFENLAVKAAAEKAEGHRKLYKVVREGNFFMPGVIGFLLKYCNTLPLSSNMHTMLNFNRAAEEVLNSGNFLLVYPEQSMWWNYKKPRPYRIGAYYFAAKCDVPVVPCFTTLEESGKTEKNGFPGVYYTIHIMKPIYPDKNIPTRLMPEDMLQKNAALCRDKYTQIYGKAPEYPQGKSPTEKKLSV